MTADRRLMHASRLDTRYHVVPERLCLAPAAAFRNGTALAFGRCRALISIVRWWLDPVKGPVPFRCCSSEFRWLLARCAGYSGGVDL